MEVRAGYKRTEVGVIPSDWVVKKLGDISYFSQGIQVDLEKQSKSEKPNYSKFLRIENYTQESDDYRYIPSNFGRNKWISKDDVVVVRYGATAGFIGQGKEGVLANNLFKVEPNPRLITNGYLFNYLKSDYTYNFFQNSMFGGAMPALSFKIAKDLLISLPPTIKEQTLIATALSDSDALISSLEKLIAKKRNIKKGAMQELLKPKDGWLHKKLKDLVEIRKGQLITDSTRVQGNIPVIAGGKTPAYYHNKANRTGKTITISSSGASAGYISFHSYPIFASDCSTISESADYSIEFVYYLLFSMQEKIYKMQTGGAQPHIHPRDLNPIPVVCPDKTEQSAIASTLLDMDAEITALETKLEKCKMIKQGMMQTLLTGEIRLIF
jgi:type I restriction enzyme S subunit